MEINKKKFSKATDFDLEAELDTALFLNKPPFKGCFSLWKRVVLVVYFPFQEVLQGKCFSESSPTSPRGWGLTQCWEWDSPGPSVRW